MSCPNIMRYDRQGHTVLPLLFIRDRVMCYQLVYLIFDFPTDAPLKDGTAMEHCLSQLLEKDFHLTDEDMDSPATAWNMALRKGQRSMWVSLEDAASFGITLSVITNNWRRLYLSFDRAASEKLQHVGKLAQAGEVVYQILKPDYGYGLVSLDTQLLYPPGEGDYGITTIYDYNFFSPRLLNKLGRDKINAVPANRKASFDDGGVLLQLTPDPLGSRKPYTANYEAAVAALGAAKYQQGC
jgi:hypothetical protein